MKHTISILLLFVSMLLSPALLRAQKPFVIPELKQWTAASGTLTLTPQSAVVYADDAAAPVAEALANDYAELFGARLAVRKGKAAAGDVELKLRADKKLGSEGYRVNIGKTVAIDAPTAQGLFWATRTLLQLTEGADKGALPCGKIVDWPDYALRGFMIDCGRKYIPISYLRDYVKIMAYYKMNALQVHLNDNGFKQFFGHDWGKTYAAFRLESETFPGLAAQDGFYTKREFIDLQKLGEANFVDIIPEIDAPAHTLAFAHYKPSLGSKEYGMDHLDLFNPEVYDFMDALWREYLEGDEPVFRGKRVHIGTDEYSNRDSLVVEKFRYFTDRYIKYIESFGKQACVWGALTHAKGNTPVKVDNVLMWEWYNGYADPKDMIDKGYRVVSIPDGYLYIVPEAGYYYNYLNTPFLYESWTPAQIGNQKFDEKHPAIEGGMFAVWNDHCGNGISVKDIHNRTFPALQTLAVKMWTGANPTLPFADFDRQRHALSEAPGVNQGGRLDKGNGGSISVARLAPGAILPADEVGGTYSVSFDIDGTRETPGTELFRSDYAVFYLADPITGMIGYARDGYLNTFPYSVKDEKVSMRIEGDPTQTSLFVNDRLIEKKDVATQWFDSAKVKMRDVRTLVFPLRQAGDFKSVITNLEVKQEAEKR
jgi:hexosaminidase